MSFVLVPAHVALEAKCQPASGPLFSLYFPLSKRYQSFGVLFQTVHITDNAYSLKDHLLQVKRNIYVKKFEREKS